MFHVFSDAVVLISWRIFISIIFSFLFPFKYIVMLYFQLGIHKEHVVVCVSFFPFTVMQLFHLEIYKMRRK